MTALDRFRPSWVALLAAIVLMAPVMVAPQDEVPLPEHAEYIFSYLGFSVARGSLTVSDTVSAQGRPIRHIEVQAGSMPATSFLFRLDNRYLTTIDAATGYPLEYRTHIVQSNFQEESTIRFDQQDGTVYQADTAVVAGRTPLHNLFSALYLLLHHTFQPNEKMNLSVYAAAQLWDVQAEALKVEKVATEAGTFSAVRVDISFARRPDSPRDEGQTDVLTSRLTSEGKKTSLWLSTGDRRCLAKGEYDLFPAALQMLLTSHQRWR